MEENYLINLENDTNEPSDACLKAILIYSKLIQSFDYEDIRFKFLLN